MLAIADPKGPAARRRASFLACVVALVTLAGTISACGPRARVIPPVRTNPQAPIALQSIKLVDYFPAGASWTNMWSDFDRAQIAAGFAKVKQLGANAVRLTIDPYEFGWPSVPRTMANELQTVIKLAKSDGLYVQLTLFDWFTDYTDMSDSRAWLASLLHRYRSDPEIAFIDLQNEINTSSSQAMAWAKAIMRAAKPIAGTIPLTFSVSSPRDAVGELCLKHALGGEAPAFYDFHYYGLPGAAASVLAAVKAAVAPAPLFVGETGMSTYSPSGPAQEAILASQQANYYSAVEAATSSLGLPPAAPWMLNDLLIAGVPSAARRNPVQLYYGLYTTGRTPKPAAGVVKSFFSTGSEPLLLNPGFEHGSDGVPTGWSPSAAGTGRMTWAFGTAHSGLSSAEISGSGAQADWNEVINTGALRSGQELQATVWAEGSGATGSNVLSLAWFGAVGNYISNNVSAPLPDGASNWTKLGVDAIAPPGAVYAKLYLQSSNNEGSVWFDDATVSFIRGAFPALPAVAITSGAGPSLSSPGFEQGTGGLPTGWAPSSPATGTMTWTSVTAHSGSFSVEITASGAQADWKQVINTGDLGTGEKVQATVWAKGSAVTGFNELSVAWFGAAGNYISNNVSSPLASGNSNWTELVVNATAPAGAAYADLYLQSSYNSGSVWFDDANVVFQPIT